MITTHYHIAADLVRRELERRRKRANTRERVRRRLAWQAKMDYHASPDPKSNTPPTTHASENKATSA